MLQFSESLLKELRKLRRDTEELVLSNRVKNMEQYGQLMGRLEGYKFVEDLILDLLKKNPED
jgi:hypothetical protein